MIPTLPPELIDSIIDCLQAKKKALGRCGPVVCKGWSGRPRHHLWKMCAVVVLCCDDDNGKLNRFLDLPRRPLALAPLTSRFKLSDYDELRDGAHPRGTIFPLPEVPTSLGALNLESVQLNLSHASGASPRSRP